MNISAVIPTYNRPDHLPRAVESVLSQTRPVEEIIIVDDGSTGPTREVAMKLQGPIVYIYQQNRGLAGARNTGIRAAKGDWVAFLDDDDLWLPDKIRCQEEALRSSAQAVLVYTGHWCAAPNGDRTLAAVPQPNQLWPMLRARNPLSPGSVIVRKDVLMEAGGFNEQLRVVEDWDLWVRLHAKGSFAAVLQPLVIYQTTPDSLSRNFDRMLQTTERILESTLLDGLEGSERSIWRRRIRSAQRFTAAIEAGPAHERKLLFDSLTAWPSPLFLPQRYAALLRVLLGPALYAPLRRIAKTPRPRRGGVGQVQS